jgi:hypothetical protein
MKKFMVLSSVLMLFIFIVGCGDDGNMMLNADQPEMKISEDSDISDQSISDENSFDQRGGEVMYEIELENLTPATGEGSSQPFSPPVLVIHKSYFSLFKIGHNASDELRQIAEDAVNMPMIELLKNTRAVKEVVEGSGVILPGMSYKFDPITTSGRNVKLSLVGMLVNTNDGFVGASRLNLPRRGKKVYYLKAYDSGTEQNTELKAHIPGPCCGSPLVRVPTHEKVRIHRGILGIGDLEPQIYDWNKIVAKLTITSME